MKKRYLILSAIALSALILGGCNPKGNSSSHEHEDNRDAEVIESNVVVKDGIEFYKDRDGSAIVINYSGKSSVVNIPDTVDGWPVTKIKANAFANNPYIEEVNIPSSVEEIGSSAFHNCKYLKTVNGGEGLKTVDEFAFANDVNLSSISLPNSLTYLGAMAFSHCMSLTSFAIPNSLQIINQRTFDQCDHLKTITGGTGVKVIDGFAFSDCVSLTGLAQFNSLQEIRSYAFGNCVSIIKMVIPNTVKYIEDGALYGCSSLEELTIPFTGREARPAPAEGESTYDIYGFGSIFGYSNFKDSYAASTKVMHMQIVDGEEQLVSTENTTYRIPYSLWKVTLSQGVEVRDYAFYNASNLSEINIPSTVRRIGNYAFGYCSYLNYIEIRESVEEIESNAFYGCSILTAFVHGDETEHSSRDSGWKSSCRTIYDYQGQTLTYKFYEPTDDPDNPRLITTISSKDPILLPEIYKEGYYFDGWYLDQNFTQDVTFLPNTGYYDLLEGHRTLYAKYHADTFVYVVSSESGNYYHYSVETTTDQGTYVEKGIFSGNFSYPTIPVRTGYSFTGWKEKTTQGLAPEYFDFTATIDHDIYLVAQWKKVEAGHQALNLVEDDLFITVNSAKEVYEFVALQDGSVSFGLGYNGRVSLAESESELVEFNEAPVAYSVEAGKTYYVAFAAMKNSYYYYGYNYYTVSGAIPSYNTPTQSDSGHIRHTVTYGESYTLPSFDPDGDEGLLYYYVIINGREVPISDKDGNPLPDYEKWCFPEDTIIYAKTGTIRYNITYHNVTGATVAEDSEPLKHTYKWSDEEYVLPNMEMEGRTFNGWSTDVHGYVPISSIPNHSSGDIELYAQWDGYVSIFRDDENYQQYHSGDKVSQPSEPVLTNEDGSKYFVDWQYRYVTSSSSTQVTTFEANGGNYDFRNGGYFSPYLNNLPTAKLRSGYNLSNVKKVNFGPSTATNGQMTITFNSEAKINEFKEQGLVIIPKLVPNENTTVHMEFTFNFKDGTSSSTMSSYEYWCYVVGRDIISGQVHYGSDYNVGTFDVTYPSGQPIYILPSNTFVDGLEYREVSSTSPVTIRVWVESQSKLSNELPYVYML